MKFQRICISFGEYTDADLLTKSESIWISMTGNANFTNPTPTLADFKTAIDDYGAALANAEDQGRYAVAQKNQQRELLETLLTQLGLYVMLTAMGDVTALTSSGFSLSKVPSPRLITNPGVVSFKEGITSGQLITSVKAVPGASGYLHEITPEPFMENSVWESTPSTKSRFTYNDLESGKRYLVRVAAVGADNQVAYGPASSTGYIR